MVNLTWVFNMELVTKIKSTKNIRKILDTFEESQKEYRKKRKQELCEEKAKLLKRIKQIDLELKGL